MELTLCEDNLTETRSKTKNLEKEILAREERIQELEDELARLNQSHKELSESRQFIAALVTPLCLFGVIALGFLLFTCAKEPRGTCESLFFFVSPGLPSVTTGVTALPYF